MKFDTTDKDIILVSYPAGGFGNFIFHALSIHGRSCRSIKFKNAAVERQLNETI
jgi:hypothetical protein